MPIVRRIRPAQVAPTPRPVIVSPAEMGWRLGMACIHPRTGVGEIDAFAELGGIWHAFVRHNGYHRNTCRVDELKPFVRGVVRRTRA